MNYSGDFIDKDGNKYYPNIRLENLKINKVYDDMYITGYRVGNLCVVNFYGSEVKFTEYWKAYPLATIENTIAVASGFSVFTNQNGEVGDLTIGANDNTIYLNYRGIVPTATNSWIRGQLIFICK